MPDDDVTDFSCPNCGDKYKVVRAEAPPAATDHWVACLKCGAPFNPRIGKYLLKYLRIQEGDWRGPRLLKALNGKLAGQDKAAPA